jgi:hypothetical protein
MDEASEAVGVESEVMRRYIAPAGLAIVFLEASVRGQIMRCGTAALPARLSLADPFSTESRS